MNDRRYQILWLSRHDLIDLIHGAVRITNLPADCQVEAMCADMHKDAIGLRLWSKEFPIMSAEPGAEIRTFNEEFQSVGKSVIALEYRYANDARFHALVRTIIQSISQEGVTLDDIRQALMIVERIHIVSAPKSDTQSATDGLGREWRDVAIQREVEQASFKAITGQDMPMPEVSVEFGSVRIGPSKKWSSARVMMEHDMRERSRRCHEDIDPVIDPNDKCDCPQTENLTLHRQDCPVAIRVTTAQIKRYQLCERSILPSCKSAIEADPSTMFRPIKSPADVCDGEAVYYREETGKLYRKRRPGEDDRKDDTSADEPSILSRSNKE